MWEESQLELSEVPGIVSWATKKTSHTETLFREDVKETSSFYLSQSHSNNRWYRKKYFVLPLVLMNETSLKSSVTGFVGKAC